ncbi:MAG: hypothetical protein Q3979_08010 [Actinomycetaceae bacterium]|nr:hypothetical protein [Actinomycetaceae bacterium]
MSRKLLAGPTVLVLALSGLGACSLGSSASPIIGESSVTESATSEEPDTSDSPSDEASSSDTPSDDASTDPEDLTGEDVTAMTITKNTDEGSDTSEYIYSGLIFTFPEDAEDSNPYKPSGSSSWRYFVGGGEYPSVAVDWRGDNPSETSREAAQSEVDAVGQHGVTATTTDTDVDGAKEAILVTWTADDEEIVKENWPDAQTSRMTCRVLFVTGTNDFVYDVGICHPEGDAEAKALADSTIESIAVDEGYPANTPEATR